MLVYRVDDVPIPLRPAFEAPYPSDEVVLKAIEKRIRQLQRMPVQLRDGSGADQEADK